MMHFEKNFHVKIKHSEFGWLYNHVLSNTDVLDGFAEGTDVGIVLGIAEGIAVGMLLVLRVEFVCRLQIHTIINTICQIIVIL